LDLTEHERKYAFHIIEGYLNSQSAIVQTCSLECLYDLGEKDAALREKAIVNLQQGLESKFKTVQTRSRKILSKSNVK